MAVTMEDRPRPLLIPLQTDQSRFVASLSGAAVCSDAALWSACAVSAIDRPQPILPDTDNERMSDIDNQALANLKSFDSQPREYYPGNLFGISFQPQEARRAGSTVASSPTSPEPFSAVYDGRRHTLASPDFSTSHQRGYNGSITPTKAFGASRRRSAPSTGAGLGRSHGRRGAPEPGSFCVVPRQLVRPSSPTKLPCGAEIWWPVQPNGEVKVHVGITSRSGIPEKLSRCYDPSQLQMTSLQPLPTDRTPDPDKGLSFPTPGTVLPVPGSAPQTPSSAMSAGRRFSTAPSFSPVSPHSPSSGRRASHEFPAEYINKDRAEKYLPILGNVFLQTKRPIRGDERIVIPLPYPSAWFETVRYVYTGNEELLSESVKGNILHLGGKV